ncbi:MAG: glutamine synthetase beta-grasp domain-containing protein [Myxococcales bacterium]|nr:glutamine synthetase beta-grasp domain-containing protein [Myxococcales bacterium]MDD9972040.1 glutamine synthetase beta-grasp domain-containing protein [Myxococcales bacterium]
MPIKAEYIWLDGAKPTKQLRSKTKILADGQEPPTWGYDGSSTEQADGSASDCVLKPVFTCPDPIRGGDNVLVMAEVFNAEGAAHSTNTRAVLRDVAEKHTSHEPLFGIEQEYTMISDGWPAGFPSQGYAGPQGPFYCGVGVKNITGREIVEAHMDACLKAGLKLSGINAEVMPGQWEFQIGPAGPTEVGDHLWVARWLLHRIAEDYGIEISIEPKPMRGDWNGAGCHTNYSTKAMREDGGMAVINAACEALGKNVDKHLEVYGAGLEDRLTGAHETASFKEFLYGVGNRGASIRIPLHVSQAGKGYLEDRRPCANIDPYEVARVLIETTCG